MRYSAEPEVKKFTNFNLLKDMNVLEIGYGLGSDAVLIAKSAKKYTGIDLSEKSYDVTSRRLKLYGLENAKLIVGSCTSLDFKDNTFDLITIAFGLRNVTDKEKALNAIYRALKPGGKLVILEFSKPQNEVFREIYDLFSFEVIPKIGAFIAQTEESYRYLAESIRMHPTQEELKVMIEGSGFTKCKYENLTNGVVAIHSGQKGLLDV